MLRNLILDLTVLPTEDRDPRALEFLGFCQATRRRVFLLSASEEAYFVEQPGQLKAAHLFECVYAGVLDKDECVRGILAEHDLIAAETAFIGEMETAPPGGVMAITTLTSLEPDKKLRRAPPDVMVRDLGELQKLLEVPTPNDEIRIEELELMARVGVPAKERAQPQRLTASLTLQPRNSFRELGDDLSRTIDYAAVCEALRHFVAGREDRLIETLGHEMAEHLLRRFELARVELELRKFILPETKYVAVRVRREAAGGS